MALKDSALAVFVTSTAKQKKIAKTENGSNMAGNRAFKVFVNN
jgi:hypothetical protein